MSELKQVILMLTGTDPPMRKGKMVAQGGHAVASFIFRRMKKIGKRRYEIELTEAEEQWKDSSFAKICLKVETEREMLELYQKAKDAGLEAHLITDSGLTEFGKPTKTCVAIGPDWSEKIDPVTGHLKLL